MDDLNWYEKSLKELNKKLPDMKPKKPKIIAKRRKMDLSYLDCLDDFYTHNNSYDTHFYSRLITQLKRLSKKNKY